MKHLRRAAVIAAIGLLALLPGASAGTGDLPTKITTTAPVKYVNCGGGCCCGEVAVLYLGHYYGDPSYCRWWRPGRSWPTLREGQNVTATLRLWR